MEILILLGIVAGAVVWAYRSGKRLGSRKGYGVGRARARRRKR